MHVMWCHGGQETESLVWLGCHKPVAALPQPSPFLQQACSLPLGVSYRADSLSHQPGPSRACFH